MLNFVTQIVNMECSYNNRSLCKDQSLEQDLVFLSKLLPSYEQIATVIGKNAVDAKYILKRASDVMREIQASATLPLPVPVDEREVSYLLNALVDKYWEHIHTSHFSEVPIETRKTYALACYFRIFYILFENADAKLVEKCSLILDEAQLLGCTENLYEQAPKLHSSLMDFLNKRAANEQPVDLPILDPLLRRQCCCDIPQYDCPSVEEFKLRCYTVLKPALLLNTIRHWPALHKWRNLNYLHKVAGNRTVPIEIGTNYSSDAWSQQLMKVRDFLCRQFTSENAKQEVEYLAQHELFEQIPALKSDICTPDYCSLSADSRTNVDIKAWLGPAGTISPMHYDPKHNLLCQVFGSKYLILAAPEDSVNLYPHESEFLANTSQINPADLDLQQFPLAANSRFYNLTLQEGDCLYIPPKWWHYVRAETPSFSVSFWWE